MAWIDDRIWCHTKFSDLSDRAAWVWVKSVAYSTGLSTRGVLTKGQQKLVGSSATVRVQLVAAGLWDEGDDGSVAIHDWADHNSKRDERRVRERERLRARRKSERETKDGTQDERATVRSTEASATRVDGSEGSDGSEGRPKAVRARLAVIESEQPRDFEIPPNLVRDISA